MRRIVAMIVCAAVSASLVPLSSAAPQVESGTIRLSNPMGSSTTGVTDLIWHTFGAKANGVDGWIIELRPGNSLFALSGTSAAQSLCNLDVWFYTSEGDYVGGSSAGTGCGESGGIPSLAEVAAVSLRGGANVDFTFTAY